MIKYDLPVAFSELQKRNCFSVEVLARGSAVINEAVQQFESDGFVSREIAQRLMQSESIVINIDLTRDEELLMRNADSEQWYHVQVQTTDWQDYLAGIDNAIAEKVALAKTKRV